jgi:hypothetical protein
MADTPLKIRTRYSQLIGAIACAGPLAYLQWLSNRDSLSPAETHVLVKYFLLDLALFLAAFILIGIILSTDANVFLSSLILVVIGGICSSLLIDIRFILNNWGYREIAEGHRDHIAQSTVFILIFNCLIVVVVMSFVQAVPFVVRSARNRIRAKTVTLNSGI